MSILKIARMGHPVLWGRATPVEFPLKPALAHLLADMRETLDDAGGAGLAAPQVFAPRRLFIYHVPPGRGDDDVGVPLTTVCNPVVTPLDETQALGWEGCLSIPGLRAAVPRYTRIRLTGQDAEGTPFVHELSGFAARVVQHETDHLDGIMYPMRLRDFSHFGFNEEIERFARPLPEIS